MFLIIDGDRFSCIVPGCGQRIFEEITIKSEQIYVCMNCREWYRPHPASVVELVPVDTKNRKSDEIQTI